MTSVVEPDDLHQIAEDVWTSYLDVDGVCPLLSGESSGQPTDPGTVDVQAAVSVTGAWQGHVVLECSTTASRHAAAALLGIDAEQVSDDDVADALGELANVIGGNVKSLLPGPSALSLPYVITAPGGAARWPSVTAIGQLVASWMDEPINISVLESTLKPGRVDAA